MFAFISKLFSKISAFFGTPAGSMIKEAVENVMVTASQVAIDALFAQAKKQVAVIQATQPNASGDVKASQVRDYLTAYAKNEGVKVGVSLIIYAIETAVQALKPPTP